MRIVTMLLCVMGLCAASVQAEPAGKAAPADREGWPVTRAGELAHRWVQAFSAGEKAMKACIPEVMSASSLANKNVTARVERYRDLKEKFGTLTLVSVQKNEPRELEVTLAATDLSTHVFVFHVEKAPPYKLEQIGMKEFSHAGFGGFMH